MPHNLTYRTSDSSVDCFSATTKQNSKAIKMCNLGLLIQLDVAPEESRHTQASFLACRTAILAHLEDLLPVLAEPVARGIGDDLVVQGRPDEPLRVGVHSNSGDGVQARVRDVLDLHRDPKLPHADRLVIRRRHKAPPLVHERDCVHRAQVVVVLLRTGSKI